MEVYLIKRISVCACSWYLNFIPVTWTPSRVDFFCHPVNKLSLAKPGHPVNWSQRVKIKFMWKFTHSHIINQHFIIPAHAIHFFNQPSGCADYYLRSCTPGCATLRSLTRSLSR